MNIRHTKIDKLINELCSDGVEFKDVETLVNEKIVLTVTPPKKLTKKYYKKEGKYPIIDQGQNFIVGYTNDEESIIKNENYVIFGDHTEAIKYVDFSFSQGADGIKILKTNNELLQTKYFFYALNNFYIKTGKYTRHFSFLKKLKIPLPPIPIQEEIVKILDSFTELEAELEAELEERRNQYEYYRDELLTFGDDVEFKELGEVCLKTENIKWKENQDINYQYIDLSSVSRENHKIFETTTINSTKAPSRAQQIINTGDVIFGTTRPTLKRYSLITSEYHNQICSTGFCVLRANQKILLPKFLFFILKTTNFYGYVENNQEGASYPSISNCKVKKFKIPIPPIEEQERIVKILDKFDALVNDISIGLPAELEARRKQYEYYREKLLTFKEA